MAIGRALIHDADFAIKMEKEEHHQRECNRNNLCVEEMDREGLRCVGLSAGIDGVFGTDDDLKY